MNIKETISINGIPTSVRYRQGDSPVIVCIHGNSLSKEFFMPLFESKVLKRYGMLAYDLPGHGGSARPAVPEETYSMSGYAKHLETLVENIGITEMVFLGFSMGGHLALEAAGQNLADAVKGICTIGSPPIRSFKDFGPAFLPLPEGASLSKEHISDNERAVIVDHISREEAVKTVFSEAIMSSDPDSRKYFFPDVIAGNVHNEHDFLESTDIPFLYVFGENERMVNLDYLETERVVKLLGSRLKIIKDTEHLPSFTGEDSFLKEFSSFMESLVS